MYELVDSTILEAGLEFVLLSRIETEIVIVKELDDKWIEETFDQASKDSINKLYDFFMTQRTEQLKKNGNVEGNIFRLSDLVEQFNKDLINVFDRQRWSRSTVSNEIHDNQWVSTEPEEKVNAEFGRLLIVHLVEDLKGEYIHF